MVQTQRSTAASTASLLPSTKRDEQPDTVEVEPVERNERVERVVIGTTGPLGKLHWKPQIHRMLTGFVIFYMALLLIWFGVFINRDRLSFLTEMDEKVVYNVVTIVCLACSLWALSTKNAYRLEASATFMRVDGLHHLLMALHAAFSFIHRGYFLGMDNNLDVIVGCVISVAFCAVELGLVAPAFDRVAEKERARLPVAM